MLKKLTQAYILFTLDYATPSTGIWNVLRPINISKKKKNRQENVNQKLRKNEH